MTDFPVSPILKQNLRAIQRGLEEALAHLPYSDERAYIEFTTDRREILRPETEFPVWFLFHMFLYSGFIRANVLFAKHALFQFAPPGNADYCESLDRIRANPFSEIKFSIDISGNRLEISGIVPSSIKEVSSHFLAKEIVPFIQGYFAHSPVFISGKEIDLYGRVRRDVELLIRGSTAINRVVTITHLKFHEMFIFFEFLGKFRSKEVIEEIVENIRGHLKKIDTIFVLSPFSYLILSPGADEKLIQKRFQGIYFQSKSVILDYQIFTRTIRDGAWSVEGLWKELSI